MKIIYKSTPLHTGVHKDGGVRFTGKRYFHLDLMTGIKINKYPEITYLTISILGFSLTLEM